MTATITNASVEVDDETVDVEGNTLTFMYGLGEVTVRAATRGGEVRVITSEDITTKIGQIKFEVPTTVENANAFRAIKALGAGRIVRVSGISSDGSRLSLTMTQGVMTNDPEIAIQNEGKFPVEFSGAPLISG